PKSVALLPSRYVLYLIYFNHKPLPGQRRRDKLNEYWWALAGFAFTLVTSILVCGICFVLFFGGFITGQSAFIYGKICFYLAKALAKVVGIVSAVLTFFMWAPQIYTSWK